MEFSADTKSLAEAPDRVQEAVEKKSTIPILSHVLVEATPTGLRLAATDLEMGIRTFCPAQVKAQASVAAPARRFLDIVRSLPDGEVRVRALENHWVQVNAGRSVFRLAALAKDNFPALPDVPKAMAEVPAGVLAGLIDRTAFAISNQESRYTLNGALLLLRPDSVEMVATDGHRLPLAARDVSVNGLKSEERLMVPKRAVGGLRRLANAQEADSPVHIAKDESHLFFSAGDSILIARSITGQFPNYEAVLPKENKVTATLDSATLPESLRRVALLASGSLAEAPNKGVDGAHVVKGQKPVAPNPRLATAICGPLRVIAKQVQLAFIGLHAFERGEIQIGPVDVSARALERIRALARRLLDRVELMDVAFYRAVAGNRVLVAHPTAGRFLFAPDVCLKGGVALPDAEAPPYPAVL